MKVASNSKKGSSAKAPRPVTWVEIMIAIAIMAIVIGIIIIATNPRQPIGALLTIHQSKTA